MIVEHKWGQVTSTERNLQSFYFTLLTHLKDWGLFHHYWIYLERPRRPAKAVGNAQLKASSEERWNNHDQVFFKHEIRMLHLIPPSSSIFGLSPECNRAKDAFVHFCIGTL